MQRAVSVGHQAHPSSLSQLALVPIVFDQVLLCQCDEKKVMRASHAAIPASGVTMKWLVPRMHRENSALA